MQRFLSQDYQPNTIKVAFLITEISRGGAENALKSLLEQIDRKVFTPIVICTGSLGDVGAELLQSKATTMYWDLGMQSIGPGNYFELFRILREESVDLLCDSLTRAQTQAFCVAAKLALRIPIVSWVHHTVRVRPRFHQELATRFLLRAYDRVIAVGSKQRTWLCQEYGVSPDQAAVVHNGIPLESFENLPGPEQAKRALGIDPHRPVVGITAQLRPEKDHQNLLAAMRLVVSRVPDVLLVLVGDGQVREGLQELAAKYGLSENVNFLGQRRDIPNIVAAYDVGVLSSWVVETSPLSVLEYMAAGKPTVSTDVGSVSDLVLDGETGFLVPAKSPGDLANRILTLLQDRSMAARMGGTASTIVRQRFSSAAMAAGIEGVLLKAVSSERITRKKGESLEHVGAER